MKYYKWDDISDVLAEAFATASVKQKEIIRKIHDEILKRPAGDTLLEWCDPKIELPVCKPGEDDTYLVIASGKSESVRFEHAVALAEYDGNGAWFCNEFPEMDLKVHFWAAIPIPEEEEDGAVC